MASAPLSVSPPAPPPLAHPINGFVIADGPGYLRVVGRGVWTPAEIDRHFDALTDRIRALRAAGEDVRVLVDLRQSKAQTGETHMRIGVRTRIAYQPGDRVAIILDSCLAKMQMRRVIRTAQHAYFVSPDAALTWLTAHDLPELTAAG